MTTTITGHIGAVTGNTIITVPTTVILPAAITVVVPVTTISTTVTYCGKTYRQCQGTAWPGSGNCSSCGAYIGTGGVCLALVELTPQRKKHAECPCCECE